MFVPVSAVIGGLILLTWGADRFVCGAAATARNLGVKPLLIGLTVVALATSAPEILVAVVAAIRGEPDLAIGNAIGSNIVNIGLVLGLVALIRPIEIRSATLRREVPALLAVSLLTVSLFLDSYLSRVDGLVLLSGMVLIMIRLAGVGTRSPADDPLDSACAAAIPQVASGVGAAARLVIGLLALLAGAELLVGGAIDIARGMGVSEIVVGIALVAFGTSLPELAVSLAGVFKGEYGLALGNIVGSNMFNSLAVIGVASAIAPAELPPSVLSLHAFVMVAFTLVLYATTYDYGGKRQISRVEGLAMVAAFTVYETYLLV